jgi:hypothetical protein
MKIRVTVKSPDGIDDSVKEAIRDSVNYMCLNGEETDAVANIRYENTWQILKKWIRFREYITIEFDTELMEAKIIENND